MNTPNWYVLRTKPNKENQVFQQLQAHAIESYYPTIRVKPVNPRASKIRPFFPGYLFLRLELDIADAKTILWLPGSIGLVEFGGVPATVSEPLLMQIQQRIKLIEATGNSTLKGLKPGDSVRIVGGPFAGYEAIFDMRLNGNERVQVLLQLLGHLTKVEVDASAIEKKRPK